MRTNSRSRVGFDVTMHQGAAAAVVGVAGGLVLLSCITGDRVVAANAECAGGECVCHLGFGDCDGDMANGCETAFVDNSDHCGSCGNRCYNAACHADHCVCLDGFADCDADMANGCEAELAVAPEHCGACGHDCQGGGCAGAQCLPAQFTDMVDYWAVALALGPPYLYTAVYDRALPEQAVVVGIPLAGGPPEFIAEGSTIKCIAVTATDVFWRTSTEVWRAPRSTHEPTLVAATSGSPQDKTGRCIGASSAYVYWFTKAGLTTRVERAPVTGGDAELIGDDADDFRSIVADADDVYWTDGRDLWHVAGGGSGPGPESIAHDDLGPFGDLAIGGEFVYFGDALRTIWKVPRAGGEQIAVIRDVGVPIAVAVDDTNVYWTDLGRRISTVSVDGGEPVVLATNQDFAFSLAVDEAAVYWIVGLSGTVMRLVK